MGRKHEVGHTLVKRSQAKDNDRSSRHTTSVFSNNDNSRLPIRSITEQTGLAEFFNIAELANHDFKAQKRNVKILSTNEIIGVPCLAERENIFRVQELHKDRLKVPRRPKWNKQMTADEFESLENEEFLRWRRLLAEIESTDGLVLTPFERNLEFWRQLWRVVERSDVIVQLVDARQPLLYYCKDLENYVSEVNSNKVCYVLVNKSDFLTDQQRLLWFRYFESIQVRVIFWSAALASQIKLGINSVNGLPEGDDESDLAGGSSDEHHSSDSDALSDDDTLEEIDESGSGADKDDSDNEAQIVDERNKNVDKNLSGTDMDKVKIVTVDELLDLLTSNFSCVDKRSKPNQVTVGFVGYPNVGKSSTLNAILGHKKVSVSTTPGKTKHFQTICIRPDLVLCDCPGLVMPSFTYSKADLVCAGILSVDEMRDCLSPIGLICNQIPRSVLEIMYGITLPSPKMGESPDRPPTPHELLGRHAFMHGFMTAKGNPHYDRSARLILKDYVSGRLLYCHSPPGSDSRDFQTLGRIEIDGCLPVGVGYLNESKIERFIMRKKKIDSKSGGAAAVSSSNHESIIEPFDRMVFAQAPKSSGHIRSHKQVPVLRSTLERDKGQLNDDGNDDTASTTDSWSTVGTYQTQTSLGSSIMTSFGSQVVVDDVNGIRKPWRLLSHSKALHLQGSNGRKHKRKEKLRRVYVHLDQHEKT